jgi:twin arginine-targeting protein translocase TatB
MFGIGSGELLLILVVALLVLGPKKLPEVARTLGKAMGELRRVSTEFQRTLNTEIAFDEDNREREARKAKPAPKPTAKPSDGPAPEQTQAEDGDAHPADAPADPAFGEAAGVAHARGDDQPDASTGGPSRKDDDTGAA